MLLPCTYQAVPWVAEQVKPGFACVCVLCPLHTLHQQPQSLPVSPNSLAGGRLIWCLVCRDVSAAWPSGWCLLEQVIAAVLLGGGANLDSFLLPTCQIAMKFVRTFYLLDFKHVANFVWNWAANSEIISVWLSERDSLHKPHFLWQVSWKYLNIHWTRDYKTLLASSGWLYCLC